MRIIFGPERSGRRQEGIVLYRRMIFADSANTPRSEPICFQGTVANAEFSDDGKSVMTLSGDSLSTLDTIRIWSAPLPDPPPDADNHQFTGKNAPSWLADLAELVSGLETGDGRIRLQAVTRSRKTPGEKCRTNIRRSGNGLNQF